MTSSPCRVSAGADSSTSRPRNPTKGTTIPATTVPSKRAARTKSQPACAFVPITNSYTDTVIVNSRVVKQSLARGVTQPDLLFVAEDAGLIFNLVPVSGTRTATAAWQNNDALNGNDGTAGDQFGGPGVITPTIRLSFSDQFPYWLNNSPDFLNGGDDLPASAVWGSFDENTEVPVIYPLWLNLTLEDLQRLGQGP